MLTQFAKDASGATFIYVAFVSTFVVSITALAIEYSNALRVRTQLQGTAELAAVAAASRLPDTSAATTAAIAYAQTNLPVAQNGNVLVASDVEFGNWDSNALSFSIGGSPINAVRVTTRRATANDNPMGAGMAGIFGAGHIDVSTTAIAGVGSASPACVIALDPSASKALEVNSNARIDLTNCEVHVVSNSGSALYADSNARIDADRTCVAGGYSEQSNADTTPDPETSCTPGGDPFAGLTEPSFSGCTKSGSVKYDSSNVTLSPPNNGTDTYIFCGDLEITSDVTVTFNPGTYVMKKKFLVDSNASIVGNGVTFYLAGSNAELQIDSNSTVNVTPPSSGPLAGILFYADDNNSKTHKFDSNAAANVNGVFYFPNSMLELNSNARIGAGSSCTQIVADRIYMDSNARVEITADLENCPAASALGSSGISLLQ